MAKYLTLTAPGQSYTVTAVEEDTITDANDVVLATCTPGVQTTFVATGRYVSYGNDSTSIVQNYKDGPGSAAGDGGEGGSDPELRKEFEQHVLDSGVHLTASFKEKLDYLIRNYGPVAQTPIPSPSETPWDEGDWDYLKDEDLSAYVSDAHVTDDYGRVPVYGCLFPWYQQSNTATWTSTTCEPQYLPDWCNGTPWLFDCLKEDGTPKQWSPSTANSIAVDEYKNEYLWKWWNVNYIRCNNGNRRITAVQGMDTYAEEGEVDVGVMYAARWCYFGMVELPLDGATRKYTLVVIAGAPMTDTRFPADYKATLEMMGVTSLKLFKECQRYSGPNFEISPAPYGLHSKYGTVLGGNGTTGLRPRSQRGHLMTNVSHNQHVTGVAITDCCTGKKGVTNYGSKGAGYFGGGMDRNLFIIMHLMIKSGSKNLQKYMTGQVNALKDGVQCQLGSTAAADQLPLVAPGSSAIVTRGAESGFQINDFVSVGGNNQRDFGQTPQARGRIIGFYEHVHPTTGVAYTEIVLDLQYGKTSFTYTTSHYVVQQLAPTGTTDLIDNGIEGAQGGHYDGAAYNLTGTHAGPCRVMGTEYGMGAMPIFMDVINEYQPGNLVKTWYASPQTPRQTEGAFITANYADLGSWGKSGNFYGADVNVDVEAGTYTATAPVSGTGSSSTGLCDYNQKEPATSGFRAYWNYGGVFGMAGAASGPFAVYFDYGIAYLTNGYWFTASCD